MNFGPFTSEPDSYAIMDKALELGINFFDTANVYGWKLGEGVTESIIGRWWAQGGNRRDKVIIATKVFGRMGEGPNDRRLSALHIRRACEDSLRRLQTDYIDLYQMHHVDRETPWEEIWQAMELLVQQGKVLYIGSSNFAGLHIAQAQHAAEKRNFLGLVSEQSLYNLNARMIELEVIPACQAYGLGLIPWSPPPGGRGGGWGRRAKPKPGAGAPPTATRKPSRRTAPGWKLTKPSARNSVITQPILLWPGCCTTRLSPPRSSDRAHWSSSPAACAPWRSSWMKLR
jgi:aryl-alcohol dehydrogenase-like predicted oxidoreductase